MSSTPTPPDDHSFDHEGFEGLDTLATRLADWLDGLGLTGQLAEAGLPTFQRNCSGKAVWRDPSSGDNLTLQQLLDLDQMLHQEGDDPAHAVPVALLQMAQRARVRTALLASPTHDYASLAALRGTSVDAARFVVHKSASQGTMLSVLIDERTVVPAFQFDAAGDVRAELVAVLEPLLAAKVDPWTVWGWLTQPAALLGGAVPHEAAADPEEAPIVAHAAARLASRQGA